MNYPGNASLSSAVKDRVVSTFRQTLALYHQNRTDEVAAGCNLILQMDPSFDPARKLMDKVRNPSLPIDVDSLLPQQSSGASPMQQARDAMLARDFERVMQVTSAILSDDLLNDEARLLGDEAREKLEAAPFVSQFTRRCEQNLASGNIAAAKMDLEKARSLDPTHPDVVRIGQAVAARSGASPAAAPPPSFVVDGPAPQASGRSAAQAADFGFAFEEEKPAEVSFANFSFDTPADAPAEPTSGPDLDFGGGFSFDSPTPAPTMDSYGQGNEFDFATASVAASSDDEKKIQQYLADGDRAFAAGEHQQAIDLWSRIFLIDVTNDEASERIEKAKAKRRQVEQAVEPLLTSGVSAFESGNTSKAQADFNEALRLDPSNATAQSYLDRLAQKAAGSAAAAAAAKSQSFEPSMADDNLDLGFFDDEPLPAGIEAPLIPPSPGSAAEPVAEVPAGKKKMTGQVAKAKAPAAPRKLPVVPVAAILGLLLLGAGGWYYWNNMREEPQAEVGGGQAIIARANVLASAGKFDEAIKLLQDIKATDPQHDQALVMIADLREKQRSAAQSIDGVPAEQYYTERIAAARTAFDAHDYVVAKAAFDQAMRVKPLPADLKSQYDEAVQQVSKLDTAKALFAERKFADAIANLEPLRDQDPENLAIRKLLIDAHFNNGAVALQEERTADAIRELDQVLAVTPDDEVAKRTRELAARYDGEAKDLLYKIYVKYLPLRQAK
ncbi:MAG TPA: tetratricopeptide repeat protein [Thermoanaerobaculia bacterium]|nr:tetratricopeptide repeat protein [Thermoanaerobaculia bacterium]